MQQSKESIWVIRGLIVFGLIFSAVAAFTEVPAGGADNYAHFNISRWAFRYPHLFLDHWGKPVFTILTAPIAQLGLTAVRIFNITAGLLTAWFCYRLAIHFKLKGAWFAAVVAVFTPIYFVMMPTAMTEVLFSLVLVVSIYLFFREKYLWSAIIISFLFLVRSEGLAFLMFFFMAFLVKKQYKSIPFLFTGFILFSLIGWMYYYHDFWWLINNRPYSTGAPSVYGSGKWYHYLKSMPFYYGHIVPVFLLAGTVVILLKWIKVNFKLNSDSLFLLLLVLGSFWGYLFIHSFLWWKGDTSAGLARVMAGVSPLVGIMAAFAVNEVAIKVNHRKRIFAFLLILPAIYLTGAATDYYHNSVSWSLTDPVLKKATQFLQKPENIEYKLVVHNPYFAYSTGKDAWNLEEIQYGFSDNNEPGKNLPDSTLFVWDAQFSANEGKLPLEQIIKNPDFELIKIFEPEIPFKVLGDNQYQVVIFRKLEDGTSKNDIIYHHLRKSSYETAVLYTEELTFELPFPEKELEKKRIHKGETESDYCFNMEGAEFSPTFQIPVNKIINLEQSMLKVSANLFFTKQVDPGKVYVVFSVEGNNRVYHYVVFDFLKQMTEFDVWSKTDFIFHVPQKLNKEATIKVYIWNTTKNKILLDNFRMEFFAANINK